LTDPKIDNTLKPQEYYILKALNDQIFSVKEIKSISRIENASISRNVKASESLMEINLGKYLLQDIIIGAMTGIAEAKYLETRNKRSNQETRYIPRHSALSKQIYDTIEGVNSEVANASIYMIDDKIKDVEVMSESHL
jgi:hypothetical protein